jgi:hypothetical protein
LVQLELGKVVRVHEVEIWKEVEEILISEMQHAREIFHVASIFWNLE